MTFHVSTDKSIFLSHFAEIKILNKLRVPHKIKLRLIYIAFFWRIPKMKCQFFFTHASYFFSEFQANVKDHKLLPGPSMTYIKIILGITRGYAASLCKFNSKKYMILLQNLACAGGSINFANTRKERKWGREQYKRIPMENEISRSILAKINWTGETQACIMHAIRMSFV